MPFVYSVTCYVPGETVSVLANSQEEAEVAARQFFLEGVSMDSVYVDAAYPIGSPEDASYDFGADEV